MTAYFRLTAPGITLLVMVTGFVGMWMASKGAACSIGIFLPGMLGIGLASSGASVLNNYYDRDIDRLMTRTANRPLPRGLVKPGTALAFGLLLTAVAAAVLAVFTNLLAAALAMTATVVYSYLYTVLLKRRTPYATELGGVSGALPPVIGWASVTGSLSGEALLLFALLLFWQPPHFWALALKYRNDYAAAGVPTMSVKRTEQQTNIRALAYVLLLVATSVAVYAAGIAGGVYFGSALCAGLLYIALLVSALRRRGDKNRALFVYSIVYLTVVFAAMAFDAR
jgi:protoheme IX farnesyltransferase